MKRTISIRIDPKVWKDTKIGAAKSDLKVGEYVEKALKKALESGPTSRK